MSYQPFVLFDPVQFSFKVHLKIHIKLYSSPYHGFDFRHCTSTYLMLLIFYRNTIDFLQEYGYNCKKLQENNQQVLLLIKINYNALMYALGS